jgi:L,D-transpeptidase ErfK/SrfK
MFIRWIAFLILLVTTFSAVRPVHAATYTPVGDVIGTVGSYTVKKGDNLYAIARRFDIGIVEILSVNPGIHPWKPVVGTVLTITTVHLLPEPRQGIVLNLSELRLFYFVDATTVMTFPIGIGREGWLTPLGSTTVVMKRRNPVWTTPASILAENPELPASIPAGPDNPMGAYALNLGWINYAIHGTNRPNAVGKRSSHGCVRLYPEDIDTLFHAVATGTSVTVIDKPYKLGWQDNALLLEVMPTQLQADAVAAYKIPPAVSIPEINDSIRAIEAQNIEIDWHSVEQTIAKHNGIPTVIGKRNGIFNRVLRSF